MNRRTFMQSAVVTTLACVGASEAEASTGFAGGQTMVTLYDPRFPASRAAAAKLAPGATLRPIAGDVSDLVPLVCSAEADLDMAGVTTESVPFCLQQLLSLAHQPVLDMRRLDGDLFAWTLKSMRHTERCQQP